MGVDIHLFAENKSNGRWDAISETQESPIVKPRDFYLSRNRNLFAILTNNAIPPLWLAAGQKFEGISLPRGLPEDVSPEIENRFKDWGDAAIWSSWLLLSEVENFDWYGQFVQYEAMVDKRVVGLFDDDKPFPLDQWPSDIDISYSQYKNGGRVRWTDSYALCAGDEFFSALDELKQYGESSHIRLVFWFDW